MKIIKKNTKRMNTVKRIIKEVRNINLAYDHKGNIAGVNFKYFANKIKYQHNFPFGKYKSFKQCLAAAKHCRDTDELYNKINKNGRNFRNLISLSYKNKTGMNGIIRRERRNKDNNLRVTFIVSYINDKSYSYTTKSFMVKDGEDESIAKNKAMAFRDLYQKGILPRIKFSKLNGVLRNERTLKSGKLRVIYNVIYYINKKFKIKSFIVPEGCSETFIKQKAIEFKLNFLNGKLKFPKENENKITGVYRRIKKQKGNQEDVVYFVVNYKRKNKWTTKTFSVSNGKTESEVKIEALQFRLKFLDSLDGLDSFKR